MNKRRKVKKARKLADYYFYKWRYKKALEQYLRIWKYDTWYGISEIYLNNIVTCYRYFGKDKKALQVVDIALMSSPCCYKHIQNKAELLEYFWRNIEAREYRDTIKKIDVQILDNSLLDAYLKL
jgi:tetratricopeptide (TPR) repeat protein